MYRIGMDGGGTRTRVIVVEREKEVFRVETTGINYNSFSEDMIRTGLTEAISQLEANGFMPAACSGIGIGAAGISNPNAAPYLRKVLQNLGFTCPIVVAGDQEAALLGGVGRRAGILLIAGTGSICMARDEKGRKFRCGGYGHIIDDAGSAYAVGRDILNAIVRMEDGRGPATALRDEVYRTLQLSNVSELIAWVYDPAKTKRDVAAVAACLTEEILEEDAVARQIAHKAVEELVLHVSTILSGKQMNYDLSSGEKIPLLLEGGLINRNAFVRQLFEASLREQELPVCISEKQHDAAYGASLLVEVSE